MERARRVTLSAAVFVLVCFFLPWVQVSCGGFKDSESGLDLARGGDRALWLVPLLMLVVILLGLMRAWQQRASTFALVSLVSGLVSAYLIERERVDADQAAGLIRAHVTGWYWLGLVASLVVAAAALISYLKRSRSP
ncbi:MAG: hypothetical protein DMF64_16645 [Acidobacteria bacterium]|nr:MAG: hypothetical protein DMF64_16645 [Acidobacteriota bacterium]